MKAAGPYTIGGASRKTVPRGFDSNHQRAELLLHEGLWAGLDGKPDKTIHTAAFVAFCADHFAAMWPIGKWLLAEIADAT